VLRDLLPGDNLYLFFTGTGLAPFLSIVRDTEVYDRFRRVILIHGVRKATELAYADYIAMSCLSTNWWASAIAAQLTYYPTVTREPYVSRGRLTELISSGSCFWSSACRRWTQPVIA